jgi:hypothetical protein
MHAWIFSFRPNRLRIVSRPILQFFGDRRFIFRPNATSLGQPIVFEWEALDSTLPSLRGSITLHRLGPFVLINVDAHFRTARDVAGRLLLESVGRRMSGTSLRYLCHSLHHAIATAPDKVPAHR